MSDQPEDPGRTPAPKKPHRLQLVRPKTPPKAKVTRALYDAMCEHYLKNDRTKASMARTFKVTTNTARKVIEEGYPQYGYAPLRERAILHDKAKADAEAKAATHRARSLTDLRLKAREQRHTVLQLAKAAYAAMFRQLQAESRQAVFTKGQPAAAAARSDLVEVALTKSPAPNAGKLALGAARLMAGFKVYTELEEEVLGHLAADGATGDVPGEEAMPAGVPRGLMALTTEQLDYVARTGKLPEGVDEEAIFGTGG